MKTICLIDGHNALYRAIFTQDNLYNANNEYTGGLFGLLKILHSIKDIGDMIVCFDGKSASSYRRKIYPQYKMNRIKPEEDKTPEDKIIEYKKDISIKQSLEVVPLVGIPHVCINGIEADDLIYTLTKYYSEKGNKVVVVSGDHDMLQLLTIKNVKVFQPIKSDLIEEEEFIEKYGYGSHCAVLAKAIIGDKSDNVDGVFRVGQKTVTKIMNEIDKPTIDNVIRWAETGKPSKAKERIAESRELLELNCKVVDLATSGLPQSKVLNKCLRSIFSTEKDTDKIIEKFKYHGFKTLGEMVYTNYFNFKEHEDIIW